MKPGYPTWRPGICPGAAVDDDHIRAIGRRGERRGQILAVITHHGAPFDIEALLHQPPRHVAVVGVYRLAGQDLIAGAEDLDVHCLHYPNSASSMPESLRTISADSGSTIFTPAKNQGASFSRCGRYRYAVWRTWDDTKPRVVFVGLNPSTADARIDDPTLVRCMGFARDWGFGGVVTGNLFAWRATDPRDLRLAPDPVGPANDRWLRRLISASPLTIAAWGNGGAWQGRADRILRRHANLQCLRLTAAGQPAHPLYLPKSLQPRPLKPPI